MPQMLGKNILEKNGGFWKKKKTKTVGQKLRF
jgi:hypothetical protein